MYKINTYYDSTHTHTHTHIYICRLSTCRIRSVHNDVLEQASVNHLDFMVASRCSFISRSKRSCSASDLDSSSSLCSSSKLASERRSRAQAVPCSDSRRTAFSPQRFASLCAASASFLAASRSLLAFARSARRRSSSASCRDCSSTFPWSCWTFSPMEAARPDAFSSARFARASASLALLSCSARAASALATEARRSLYARSFSPRSCTASAIAFRSATRSAETASIPSRSPAISSSKELHFCSTSWSSPSARLRAVSFLFNAVCSKSC
mmetsp:Transcript_97471/g.178680  ORF Transcript_97471/g.178680 Transcript_97471/m.178680 type:complete len:269 (-) Transcript_97471:1799-2605(-)